MSREMFINQLLIIMSTRISFLFDYLFVLYSFLLAPLLYSPTAVTGQTSLTPQLCTDFSLLSGILQPGQKNTILILFVYRKVYLSLVRKFSSKTVRQ